MKTKIFSKKLLLLTLSFLLFSNLVFAHGPEEHLDQRLCEASDLDQWFSQSGPCEPPVDGIFNRNNNPNLADGITREDYPNGLCFPSFNNYTDNFERDADGNPTGFGLEPYLFDEPLFPDERRFFTTFKWQKDENGNNFLDPDEFFNPSSEFYSDNMEVEPGDKLTFIMYIHNDGDPCFNEYIEEDGSDNSLNDNAPRIPEGRTYSDWNTTAKDTLVRIFPSDNRDFLPNADGKLELNLANNAAETEIQALILANNAVNENGLVGAPTADPTILVAQEDNLYLEYNEESVIYVDVEETQDEATEHNLENGEDLVQGLGIELSTLIGEDFKSSGGEYFASEPYIGLITFNVEVKQRPPETPNVCEDFNLRKGDVIPHDTFGDLTELNLDGPQFTDGIPDGARFAFESTDPNGKFFARGEIIGNQTPIAQLPRTQSEEFPFLAPQDINWRLAGQNVNVDYFYQGTGEVSVKVVLLELNENGNVSISETGCEGTVNFDEEPPAICEALTLTLLEEGETEDNDVYRVFEVESRFNGEEPENLFYSFRTNNDGELFQTREALENAVQDELNNEDRAITRAIETQRSTIIIKGNAPLTVSLARLPDEQIGKNCNANFIPTERPPEVQVCNDLLVNHFSEIKEGTFSKFVAKSIGNDDEVFNGKITYTVEEGHGSFFLEDDLIAVNNQSEYIEEFDESEAIPVPANGFCQSVDLTSSNTGGGAFTTNSLIPQLDKKPGTIKAPETIPAPDESDLESVNAAEDNVVELNAEIPLLGSELIPLHESEAVQAAEELADRLNNFGLPFVGRTTVTVDPGTEVYFYANRAGEQVIKVDTECTADKACIRAFDVVPGDQLVCTDIKEAVVNFTGERTERLNRNQVYQINSNLSYNPELDAPSVKYEIPANAGAFVMPPLQPHNLRPEQILGFPHLPTELKTSGYFSVEELLALNSLEKNYTRSNLERVLGERLKPTLTIGENKPVILFTYQDGVTENAKLKMSAVQFASADCEAEYDFAPEEAGVCVDLSLDPVGNGFDPSDDFTLFNITGDFQDHPGAIEVTLDGKGEISKADEDNYSNKVTFSPAEVVNDVLQVSYKADSSYDEDDDTVTLRVKAVGAPTGVCEDQITKRPEGSLECVDLEITRPDEWNYDEDDDELEFRIDVETNPRNLEDELYYHWEVSGEDDAEWEGSNDDQLVERGDLRQVLENLDDEDPEDLEVNVYATLEKDGRKISACSDVIRPEDEEGEEGEFEKFVYEGNDPDERERSINISSAVDEVTYLLVYENGEGNQSLEIEDKSLSNGKIDGSQNGELDFRGMVIYLQEDGDDEGETLYQSDNYDEDNSDEEFGDDNYRNTGESTSYYEDEYSCNPDSDDDDEDDRDENDDFCLDYEDFDDIEEDFQNGDPTKFKNLDKLDEDDRIIVKYQMEVDSAIDEGACEDLDASDGCGESFENEAEVHVYEDDDHRDLDYSLSDEATVVVLCPYVITRSGGDVFFADEIEAGINIGQCSPTENTDGVEITPRSDVVRQLIKSGAGDEAVAKLQVGTQNSCVLSNFKGLENEDIGNFSSSVCNLNTEINETWTEENINEQIRSNFVRLTRWGRNLGENRDFTFTNISELKSVPNKEKGVFVVKDGDITIGTNAQGAVTINGEDTNGDGANDLPAALTFIAEGGNINVKSNVVYGSPANPKDPKSIPSLALIAIDGNITIDNDVERIDAALMAVDLYDNGNGKVTNGNLNEKTEVPLIINGSLFGDVSELFKTRVGVFDPKNQQGSIVVMWNLSLITNPSAILTQLFSDVQQVFSQ